DACREAHGRPDGAVESRNVLADEVDVGRPPLAERRLVVAVTDACDVRQQRVEPDVNREALVERDADAPLLPGARYVEVLQPLVGGRAEDLVAAALRLNEARVFLVILQQPVLERGQLEEVALLATADGRRLVVGTEAARLGNRLIGLELLAADTVPALVV